MVVLPRKRKDQLAFVCRASPTCSIETDH